MAVIDKFEVTVESEGQVLQEYDENGDDTIESTSTPRLDLKQVTKFIEVESDTYFKINIRGLPGFYITEADYMSFSIAIDGKFMMGAVAAKDSLSNTGGYMSSLEGVRYGSRRSSRLRKFIFGRLDILEDVPSMIGKELKQKFGEIGSINVKVWPCRGGIDPNGTVADPGEMVKEIPEKAMKGDALDLAARLDEPGKRRPGGAVYKGERIATAPLATFVFKYRSRGALQKLRIIDRSHSPPTAVPLEERNIDDLTVDEMRELLRRQQEEREGSKVKIKREGRSKTTQVARKSKRSTSETAEGGEEVSFVGNAKKKTRTNPDEVVDISDDD